MGEEAREKFKKRLEERRSFKQSFWYWAAIVIWFDYLFCCLNRCCAERRPKSAWSRNLYRLRRFQAAREALRAEQDIESIV